MIKRERVNLTIDVGVATGYTGLITGKIIAVQVNYPTNTCEVDLDTYGEQKSQKIMDLAASNTDVTHYPRILLQTNTGANIDTSDTEGGDVKKYGYFYVNGKILVSVASGTDTEVVIVDILYEN